MVFHDVQNVLKLFSVMSILFLIVSKHLTNSRIILYVRHSHLLLKPDAERRRLVFAEPVQQILASLETLHLEETSAATVGTAWTPLAAT